MSHQIHNPGLTRHSIERASPLRSLIAHIKILHKADGGNDNTQSGNLKRAQQVSSQASSKTAESAITLSDGHTVSLQAQLHYARDSQTFYLQYQLRNDSPDTAMAVFNRGVYGDWAGVAYAPGPVGEPRVSIDGDQATLTHSAVPGVDGDMRTMPIAVHAAPGAMLSDAFIHAGFDGASPKRVCWCLGIAAFDDTTVSLTAAD